MPNTLGIWNTLNSSGSGSGNSGASGVLIEHFFNTTNSTGPTGPLELTTGGNGAGAATAVIAVPDNSALGVQQSVTGTTTTGRHGVLSGASSIVFGGIQLVCTVRFQLPILFDANEKGFIFVGFGDLLSTVPPVDGAFLYWDDTQANFRYRTRANNVQTDVDSGLAPIAATWYVVQIQVNAAGSNVNFQIGTPSATALGNSQNITTNIPTGVGRETSVMYNIVKNGGVVGTTSRAIYVDYMRLAWSNANA